LVVRVSKQAFPLLYGCSSGKHVYVVKAVCDFLSCAVKLILKKEERHGYGGEGERRERREREEREERKIPIFLVHITRLLAKSITNILSRRNRAIVRPHGKLQQ
jgi:hypothetical protein